MEKLFDADTLYTVGLILVFAGSALWIKGILSVLSPLAPFGALLIVVGGVLSLINKFKK